MRSNHNPQLGRSGARVALTPLLALLAFTAHAAALRGVNLGDPCRKAIEIEARNGLTPKFNPEQSLMSNHAVHFEGVGEGGGKMEVYYRCTDDNATIESISMTRWPANASAARATFARDKAELLSALGPATLDTESMSVLPRTRLWRINARYYAVNELAVWTATSNEMVSVELSQDRDTREWLLYSLRARPAATGHHRTPDPSTTVPLDALLLVVTLAAVLAALSATYTFTFRWPLVVASSCILSYVLFWLPTWHLGNAAPDAPEPDPSFPSLVAGMVTTLLVSSWIVRALGHRLASSTSSVPGVYTTARRLIQIACGLLVAMELWIHWLFRPGQETKLTTGRLTLTLFGPLTVLSGIALAYLGTTRLLKAPRRTEHIARSDTGYVIAGALIVILSASGFVVDLLNAVLPH